jgi:hypothetical protein
MASKKRSPRGRGRETFVCSDDGRDHHTTVAQLDFFEAEARADERTIGGCDPCPVCAATFAIVGPGKGRHHAELRCLLGHHVKWLPKPGSAT